jgi:hypothetical protein
VAKIVVKIKGRAAYEGYVSHASKLGELYTDLAKEAFKPYERFVAK